MKTAKARFVITSWDEKPYHEQPKLTRASVVKTLTGDIEGESRIEYTMAYRADGTASFVGIERVVGRVGDRKGSFLMRRVGAFENGMANETYTVIAGSGTDGLAGLTGEGKTSVGHGMEHPFELSYQLG